MKNKISFLVVLTLVSGVNCANASECVGQDCELTPIVLEQNIDASDVLKPVQYDIDWNVNECETCEIDTCEYENSCTYSADCPFETAEECEIWYKKPVHKTTLLHSAPHFNTVRVDEILYAIYSNYDVSANHPAMSPLLQRYKMLMRASHACCSEGAMHKMRLNGATDAEIYQFLKDDANYFAVTQRCMVMNNNEFESSYSNGVTGKMMIDVRNACLCKNRQWFDTLLEPFKDIYERAPMFEDRPFVYTYKDDMQRDVTVYINDEVHTTMGLLGACPK